MNTIASLESLRTIDCQYEGPRRAAAYLVVENDHVAFIDNNTVHAVPHLLKGLQDAGRSPEHVEYLIVTHAHLDHAGGTAALLAHCPNATVIAHERAARHIIDPTRLVAGAKHVYGEERFAELYGEIDPIDEARVRIVQDNETVDVGGRQLQILYTLGHAKHHFAVYDAATNSAIAGDNFGNAYPDLQNGDRPFIFFCSAPTDFDAAEARKSVQKIIDTGADRVFIGHYGIVTDPKGVSNDLIHSIDRMEAIQIEASNPEIPEVDLESFCTRRVTEELIALYQATGATLTERDEQNLQLDIWLNWNGVHWNATKARKKD
jgi:glyoxylase-like metal-dependent hydrolase (beta-lactamase superfamily II)